jgi:hypothetical protein
MQRLGHAVLSNKLTFVSEKLPILRRFSASVPNFQDDLKAAFAEALPKEQDRLKALKTNHGNKDIHPVNVNMVIGGMRGITGLLYETSLLDSDEGIRFRGHSIPELQVRAFPAN